MLLNLNQTCSQIANRIRCQHRVSCQTPHGWKRISLLGFNMNLSRRSDKSNRKRKKSSSKKDLHCTVHFLDQSSQVFRLNASFCFYFSSFLYRCIVLTKCLLFDFCMNFTGQRKRSSSPQPSLLSSIRL